MNHTEAFNTALALVDYLRSVCLRIEIKGSIARLKADVKDIEILCVPDPKPVGRAPLEFGKPIPPSYGTALDKLIDDMRIDGDVRLELNGKRYKKFYLNYAGIKVDLFINLSPSEWGVQSVIRTGPDDFSHWVVTQRKYGGALPNGYFVKHQVVWLASEIDKYKVPRDPDKAIPLLTESNHLSMPEESDFFNFLELEWTEPKDRVAKWKK